MTFFLNNHVYTLKYELLLKHGQELSLRKTPQGLFVLFLFHGSVCVFVFNTLSVAGVQLHWTKSPPKYALFVPVTV